MSNASPSRTAKTSDEIRNWLTGYLAEVVDVDAESIGMECSFDQLGLDSAAAVDMTLQLEDWLGFEIDPTLPYEFRTIAAISEKLEQESKVH